MARIRTTKNLGQRVDRTYLKRLYPIPLWRRILTLAGVLVALLWLGIYAVARNQTPYTSGALTPAHAFLGKKCAVCHGDSAGIGKKVDDRQCAACHDGPVHQASATFNPACVSCHVEHRGDVRLSAGIDAGCLQCHANLHTKTGTPAVAAKIDSFANHPEFAKKASSKDATGLRFNHQKHVGELSQKCADCHAPAETAQPASQHLSKGGGRVSSHALISIPTYAGVCLPCHALTIDDKLTELAPHDKPEVVHPFVQAQFTQYIAAHPGDLGKDGAPGSAKAWVDFKVAAAEKKLLEETCTRCHTFTAPQGFATAAVTPTAIPARWFTKGSFDHSAHKELTCASCHAKAASSTVAADVLLPGIGVCRQCHAAGSASAGASCSTCHIYHDWSKEKPVEGKYVIDQVSRLNP